MFELSDDEDEHFWNDIPLHDVKDSTSGNTLAGKRPQLRVPESSCIGQPAKKLCTERVVRDPVESPNSFESTGTYIQSGLGIGSAESHRLASSEDDRCNRISAMSRTSSTNPRRSLDDNKNIPNTSDGMPDFITPKRKRKFPGPAGILPKLTPGQSLDIGLHVSETKQKENKSPQQEEGILLSSQSSESLFLDDPWQALLKDIGEEGLTIMRKFSLASTLLKAGKKQLYQGKAWLLFGVIESIENHGSEASVSIKDKSGKMQGTIHNDLMTEYEAEFQIGSVLVLKQVSIISISNKNHYLNITPNNLVCLYHIRENTLKSLHFHGSQDSLHSVLRSLEEESTNRRNVDSTPDSSRSGSRRSVNGSGTSTPVSSSGNPDALNKRLFNTYSPACTTTLHNRTPSVNGVRDVTVIPRNTTLNTNSNISNTFSWNKPANILNAQNSDNTNTSSWNKPVNIPGAQNSNNTNMSSWNKPANIPNAQKSSNRQNSSNLTSGNVTKHSGISGHASNSGLYQTSVPTPSGSVSNQTHDHTTSETSGSSGSSSKWRFRSPTSSVTNSPNNNSNITQKTNVPFASNTNVTHASHDTHHKQFPMNKGSSGGNESTLSASRPCQLQATLGGSHTAQTTSKCINDPDLWEDDLSDEILSQLTDDMT